MDQTDRITREEMFMEMAVTASKRSTCLRKKVGCVLVKDNRVIAIGYNGVLPGEDPSYGLTEDGKSRTVHAEQNVIAFCARHGISTDGCIMFITLSPCQDCMEVMVQAGIIGIWYKEEYRCTDAFEIAKKQNIIINRLA